MKRLIAFVSLLGCMVCVCVAGEPGAGNAGSPQILPLPGHPFGVVSSSDGRWVFVAIMSGSSGGSGIAVIEKDKEAYGLKRVVTVPGPTELALTHDGKVLIAAAGDSVFLLDCSRMISGSGDPVVGKFSDGPEAGSINVNVTADDKLLFVSDEGAGNITVIDLERVRSSGYDARAVIGKIPVGLAPIALVFSPDGHYLYTTSECAAESWGWPATVKPEGSGMNTGGQLTPEGAVVVIDVTKAKTDPEHSVVARVPAGGSPVRMAISPDGRRIYVTARGSNAVLVFDAGKLVTDPGHAKEATIPVGAAPVPLAIIQHGRTLVVGNSDRFGGDASKPSYLSVLDIAKMGQGDSVAGRVEAGAFPREMCVSSDGTTLFLTNFMSGSLEVIDAENPPIEPAR